MMSLKKSRIRQACGLVFGILAPILAISWFLFNAFNYGPLALGEKVPPFILPSLNGELIVFPELIAKNTLLIFLSTDCHACIDELKCLNSFQSHIDSDKWNLIIIFEENYIETKTVCTHPLDFFRVAYEGNSVVRDLNIAVKPAFLFVNNNLTLIHAAYGYKDEASIRDLLDSF